MTTPFSPHVSPPVHRRLPRVHAGSMTPDQPDEPLAVLVFAQHSMARDGLAALLAQGGGVRVVATAATLPEALALAGEHAPTAIVADMTASDQTTQAYVELARALAGAAPLVVLCDRRSCEAIEALLEAGAMGFVSRGADTAHLLAAIDAAHRRRFYMCPEMIHRFLEGSREAGAVRGAPPPISERELEVLAHIAQGKRDRDIASVLGLSVKTIHTHRRNILRKLGVRNVTALLRRAVQMGLIDL